MLLPERSVYIQIRRCVWSVLFTFNEADFISRLFILVQVFPVSACKCRFVTWTRDFSIRKFHISFKNSAFSFFFFFFFSVPLEDGFIIIYHWFQLILFCMPSQRSATMELILFFFTWIPSNLRYLTRNFRANSAASATNAANIQAGFRSLIRKERRKRIALAKEKVISVNIYSQTDVGRGVSREIGFNLLKLVGTLLWNNARGQTIFSP